MKKFICLFFISCLSLNAQAEKGLIQLESDYSVNETANRVEKVLKGKGMTIFARIDHAKGASSVQMDLLPTELIIFGNPKIGTLLMQCDRTVAIDLPQKALIWKDQDEQVWLAYNDAAYLAKRHQLKDCKAVIKKISGALNKLMKMAIK